MKIRFSNIDGPHKPRKYPDERGFVPSRIARDRALELLREDPKFFWYEFMPAVRKFAEGRPILFSPPICGAMVRTGCLFSRERAQDLYDYFNR